MIEKITRPAALGPTHTYRRLQFFKRKKKKKGKKKEGKKEKRKKEKKRKEKKK